MNKCKYIYISEQPVTITLDAILTPFAKDAVKG